MGLSRSPLRFSSAWTSAGWRISLKSARHPIRSSLRAVRGGAPQRVTICHTSGKADYLRLLHSAAQNAALLATTILCCGLVRRPATTPGILPVLTVPLISPVSPEMRPRTIGASRRAHHDHDANRSSLFWTHARFSRTLVDIIVDIVRYCSPFFALYMPLIKMIFPE